jgi:uncharacterized lipoprotein YmbA
MSTTQMRKPIVLALIGLLCVVAAAGCGSTAPTRFYVLSSIPDKPEPGQGPAIGIGPVTLPQYLNRTQIVTRSSSNQLVVADLDQWGGALDDNVTRTLAANLSTLLGTDRVSLYPWKEGAPVDDQVTLDIAAFEADAEGNAVLSVFWSVTDAKTGAVSVMRRSSYSIKAAGGPPSASGITLPGDAGKPYDAIVAAMSKDLELLSRDIAAAIGGVRQG